MKKSLEEGARLEKILIVSGNDAGSQKLSELLSGAGFGQIQKVGSASEARHVALKGDFDLVLINMPLTDETGKELAFDFADYTNSAVMTLLANGREEIIGSFGRNKGIFIVTKPINRKVFLDSVAFVLASRRKLKKMIQKNMELTKMLEDLKAVSQAKCMLIANSKLSEMEAHRYIEKQAMDLQLTKRQVAERLIAGEGRI
jgi:AmiR/NasT family two-component response regulator